MMTPVKTLMIDVLEMYFNAIRDLRITPSEARVLFHIYKGATAKEIADITCNSVHTIRKHISNLHCKFNVKNNVQLIIKASEEV